MKFSPMGTELFHAEGRTDGQTCMRKPFKRVRNFANVLKKRNDFDTDFYGLSYIIEVTRKFVVNYLRPQVNKNLF
jgi:hypothetical protein